MSNYPTTEQLFVSEQNTNRYEQDLSLRTKWGAKEIFEKMKIFTSHGRYSSRPSKGIESHKSVISRVGFLVSDGRKMRQKCHFSDLFCQNQGYFRSESRFETGFWLKSVIIIFSFFITRRKNHLKDLIKMKMATKLLDGTSL